MELLKKTIILIMLLISGPLHASSKLDNQSWSILNEHFEIYRDEIKHVELNALLCDVSILRKAESYGIGYISSIIKIIKYYIKSDAQTIAAIRCKNRFGETQTFLQFQAQIDATSTSKWLLYLKAKIDKKFDWQKYLAIKNQSGETVIDIVAKQIRLLEKEVQRSKNTTDRLINQIPKKYQSFYEDYRNFISNPDYPKSGFTKENGGYYRHQEVQQFTPTTENKKGIIFIDPKAVASYVNKLTNGSELSDLQLADSITACREYGLFDYIFNHLFSSPAAINFEVDLDLTTYSPKTASKLLATHVLNQMNKPSLDGSVYLVKMNRCKNELDSYSYKKILFQTYIELELYLFLLTEPYDYIDIPKKKFTANQYEEKQNYKYAWLDAWAHAWERGYYHGQFQSDSRFDVSGKIKNDSIRIWAWRWEDQLYHLYRYKLAYKSLCKRAGDVCL